MDKHSSALQEHVVFQGRQNLVAVRWGDLVIHTFPKPVDSEERSLWVWDQHELWRPASASEPLGSAIGTINEV